MPNITTGVGRDPVFEAWKSWFDADPALASAVPGGLWYGLAPESVSVSGSVYAEFHLVAQERERTTCSTGSSGFYSVEHVQVRIFAYSLEDAGAAGEAFDRRFKFQTPPCPLGVITATLPEGELVFMEKERAESGLDVWHKVLTYAVTLSR